MCWTPVQRTSAAEGNLGCLGCFSLSGFVNELSCSPWTQCVRPLNSAWLWHHSAVSMADKTRLPGTLLTEEVDLLHLTSPFMTLVTIIAWGEKNLDSSVWSRGPYLKECRYSWTSMMTYSIRAHTRKSTSSPTHSGNKCCGNSVRNFLSIMAACKENIQILRNVHFIVLDSHHFLVYILNKLFLHPDLTDRPEIPAKIIHHILAEELPPAKIRVPYVEFFKALIKTVEKVGIFTSKKSRCFPQLNAL